MSNFDGGDFEFTIDGGAFTDFVFDAKTAAGGFVPFGFTAEAVESPSVGGVYFSGLTTGQDRIIQIVSGTNVKQDKILYLTMTDMVTPEEITFRSLNENIATVNSWGKIFHISDGSGNIRISSNSVAWNTGFNYVTRNSGVQTFLRYKSGSLANHITTGIDTRIIGKNPVVSMPMYTTMDHATPSYVRNTGCWAADFDLTCVSAWNSYAWGGEGGLQRCGTLISPKHFVCASHFSIPNGTTMRFVTRDNVVVSRTVTGGQTISDTDIYIGALDQAVPTGATGINFAHFLPRTGSQLYLPLISQTYRLPTLGNDQERKAIIQDCVFALTGTASSFANPSDSTRASFYEAKIVGDSGSPTLMIINGHPVVLLVYFFGGPGAGPNLSYYTTEINAAMASLGGGYTVTQVNLAGFPTF